VNRVFVVLRARRVDVFCRSRCRRRLVLECAEPVQHVVEERLVIDVVGIVVIVLPADVQCAVVAVAVRVASDRPSALLWDMGKWSIIVTTILWFVGLLAVLFQLLNVDREIFPSLPARPVDFIGSAVRCAGEDGCAFPIGGEFRIGHSLVHDAHPNLVAWEEGWVLGVVAPVVGLLVLVPVMLVIVVGYLSCT
jgi:hypothetical protein